jgi:predicted DNA-binding transcriptional regulator AlpA
MASTKVSSEELLSAGEIAKMIGVKRTTVHSYLARGRIPEPFVRLQAGPIWSRKQIDTWIKTRKGGA